MRLLHGENTMTISITALLICLLGLLMYALSANEKVSKIGYAMFVVGLFFVVSRFAPGVLSLR